MDVIVIRVSAIVCASLFSLVGCQSPGFTPPPKILTTVSVPGDTQLIVLAYDKNANVGSLKLTDLPSDVEVMFISDTSDGNAFAKNKNGSLVDKCVRCTLTDIKNSKCTKASLPKLCEAFDQANKKGTVPEHIDIYSTFGSCTKQVCLYPGWCYTVSC